MKSSNNIDEAEIVRLLAGNEREVSEAMDRIYVVFRGRAFHTARQLFPSLVYHDLEDIWQDALLTLASKILQGSFQQRKHVWPLVRKIVRWRTIDFYVKKAEVETTSIDVLGFVPEEPLDESPSNDARKVDLLELIRLVVASLPRRQRQVWEVYAKYECMKHGLSELTAMVCQETGEQVSEASVRRALQEGRSKVRDYLNRRGVRL